MDTINRLLKKQAPKRNRRAGAELIPEAGEDEAGASAPSPLFVRYVSNATGSRLAIPHEWVGRPVASIFENAVPAPAGVAKTGPPRMVQEVE